MTGEEIHRLAREAGLIDAEWGWGWNTTAPLLIRFANAVEALAVSHEREECVKIVYGHCASDNAAQRIAAAIRARGEK